VLASGTFIRDLQCQTGGNFANVTLTALFYFSFIWAH